MSRASASARELAVAAMLWAAASGAVAQAGGVRVYLVAPATRDARTEEALVRMHGELEAAGWEVDRVDADGAEPEAVIERRHMRDPEAAVVVLHGAGRGGAALAYWVHDPWASRTTVVEVPSDTDDASLATRRAALHAAEVLRAALDASGIRPPRRGDDSQARREDRSREPDVDARDAVDAERDAGDDEGSDLDAPAPDEGEAGIAIDAADGPARGLRLGLALGPGVLHGFDELDAVLTPVARLSVGLPRAPGAPFELELRASAAALGSAARVSAQQGAARVDRSAVAAGLSLHWLALGPFRPLLSAELGALGLGVEGEAESPYRARTDHHWSLLGALGAGLELGLSSHLGVVLEGQALASTTRTRIRIAGETAARSGNPALLLSLLLVGRT